MEKRTTLWRKLKKLKSKGKTVECYILILEKHLNYVLEPVRTYIRTQPNTIVGVPVSSGSLH
ncbi:hypothetical protein C6502_05520 [Candidatus Poribacteria bacterium]|nr:MAG: hypothetical protein C6502_05520 [Candidatus Poribacteria bacterium]